MAATGRTKAVPMTEPTLRQVLDGIDPKLRSVLLPFAVRHPRRFWAYGKLVRGFERARKARKANREDGLVVPPFLIVSITSRCNLRCAGCYARAAGILEEKHMPEGRWREIIKEASDLGVYGFIIAGGEPFMYPALLDLCEEFDDRVFIIVTNGTAMKEEHFQRLKRISNVCIVVSLEGDQAVTDARRGPGVHERAMATVRRLGKMGVIAGISANVTAENFSFWMDPANIDALISRGVMLGVFIEHIPTEGPSVFGSCGKMLAPEDRKRFRAAMLSYRESRPIYIVHSPGDEELFGGCVSAGRGFAHITPSGDLTPCPVTDVSTHNLSMSSIREGLASELFEEIRRNGDILETGDAPCALFAHRKELDALASRVGAQRAGKRRGTST